MFRNTEIVGWDADRVMYPCTFTSIAVEKSEFKPLPYIKELVEKRKLFTYQDLERWAEIEEKDFENLIGSMAELADFLDVLHYDVKKPNSDEPVLTNKQAVEAKNALLEGMTIRQIEEISKGIEYTPDLREVVNAFHQAGIYQTLFSDGPYPNVNCHYTKLYLEARGGVPPICDIGGREYPYYDEIPKGAVLTGRTVKFDKVTAFFDHVKKKRVPLRNVAVIDDSALNVERLHVPVRNAGGLALGFNVKDSQRPKFEEYGIPVIRGNSLEPFKEIVFNPKNAVIGTYCD